MKDFRKHFFEFSEKIRNKENFCFARYSDGEMYILQNKELVLKENIINVNGIINQGFYKSQDFKEFIPNKHSDVRKKLITAFKHKQPNYYKGISCSCCVGKENFDWQINLHGGDDESLTWANLWVNGNYPLFIKDIFPIFYNRKCVFIGHKDANLKKLPFFVKDFRVGYNAMINDYDKIDIIRQWIKENNIENHLFLFSASTFTNLAVYELFRDFPNNSYVDIGTCLTPMISMPMERDYLQRFWYYKGGGDLNKICIWN